jgi:uncharacterized membrane protein YccF (DUF307 family)
MNTIGNILWLIFGGFLMGVASYITGILCFITIIFIPVGLQFFKLGKFFFWPMGKKVIEVKPSGFKTLINIIWAVLCGWEYALGLLITGVILCITIIGIPFGRQYIKVALFALLPLGHDFAAE